MVAKRVNPYQRLLGDIRAYLDSVRHPTRRTMYFYPKKDLLITGWDLMSVWERTHAAQTLEKEVVIEASDDGLRFKYRDKPDERSLPWQLK